MYQSNKIVDFLNTSFPSIDSLRSIDAKVQSIESERAKLLENSVKSSSSSLAAKPIQDTSNAECLLKQLKELTKLKAEASLTQLDKLISINGPLPVLTHLRDLLILKIQLTKAKSTNTLFNNLLNEIIGFESFDLDDKSIDNIALLQKLEVLREKIDDFVLNTENEELLVELNEKLNTIIESRVLDRFKIVLIEESKGWDDGSNKVDNFSDKNNSFNQVLRLQKLAGTEIPQYPSTIWALDCILEGFRNRFVYHFEGESETNRLDKPEFSLGYVIGYLDKNLEMAKKIFKRYFITIFKNESFSNWFITSILKPIRSKFMNEKKLILKDGKLLNHFISELKKFDAELRNDFKYLPIKDEEWNGLIYDLILKDEAVWNVWLNNEKEFVNYRYEEIMNSKDSFLIDFDIVEVGKTNPTKSSLNLKNLLEGITSNYINLPLKFQMKFLSEVQLKLLNFYFNTLKQGLTALHSIKKTKIKNNNIDNISIIERICRVWCSGKFMTETMEKWDEEVIFIELWNSINPDNDFDKTFFESVIYGYKAEILDKIPKILNEYFEIQLNKTMKNYFNANISWDISDEIVNINADDELNLPIQTLKNDLLYLEKTVSTSTLNCFKFELSSVVATYFERNIALAHSFTKNGGKKLRLDVDRVFEELNLIKVYKSYGRLMEIVEVYEEDDGKNYRSDYNGDYLVTDSHNEDEFSTKRLLTTEEVKNLMGRKISN